ncbi:MAG TPA: hypothetical protein VFI95_25385 [Terriglobales bacterium]|nr:hypothetical protein [Terriglobales bacterium]
MIASNDWQVYRTRFLVRARKLTGPMVFVDSLGREHKGDKGDYLVESSDGNYRIAPRDIFEDIYVTMGPASRELWPPLVRRTVPNFERRRTPANRALFA